MRKCKAFTLIETILVISMLVIVFSITIAFINPGRVRDNANDSLAIQNTSKIASSIEQYIINYSGELPLANSQSLPVLNFANLEEFGILAQDIDNLSPDYLIISQEELTKRDYFVGRTITDRVLVGTVLSTGNLYTVQTANGINSADLVSEIYQFTNHTNANWDFNLSNVVDLNPDSYGQDNDQGVQIRLGGLNHNNSQDKIVKVEVRYRWTGNNRTYTQPYIVPILNGNNGPTFQDARYQGNNLGGPPTYTPWYDITYMTSSLYWENQELDNLVIDLGLDRGHWGLMRIYIVEARVTYEIFEDN